MFCSNPQVEVVLTDAGLAAMRQAEQIFQLGEQLPAVVRDAVGAPTVRLIVGISDELPKLAVQSLMQSVMQERNLRLLCMVDEFEDLLGDLALHRLDVVLADRAAPLNPNLKVYSHSLGSSPLAWYAPSSLYVAAKHNFPHSLSRCPCYCQPRMLPCVQGSISGLSATPSDHTSSENLKTVPCSRHLALPVWVYFPWPALFTRS